MWKNQQPPTVFLHDDIGWHRIIIEFEFEFNGSEFEMAITIATCVCVAPERREFFFFLVSPRREEHTIVLMSVLGNKP